MGVFRFFSHFLVLWFVVVPLSATAQDSTPLNELRTNDDMRGWEGVGRLDVQGKGFCTGALISESLVLTAAHCLFDDDGSRIELNRMEFLAGLRNGRAEAYRAVRNTVVHPYYDANNARGATSVAYDLALVELSLPIRSTRIRPYPVWNGVRAGIDVAVVSYAVDRAEAPSIQEVCTVLGTQEQIVVMDCDIGFGSSGAPVFVIENGEPRIATVVSARADLGNQPVALGTFIDNPLRILRAELEAGRELPNNQSNIEARSITPGDGSGDTGAKFVRP